MKLYYSKGACSLVVRIILNELSLKADYEAVDLKDKKTAAGINFLTVNAKGAVPTLELDNGEILTENAVIMQYLADSNKATNLLPAIGDFNRYRVLEWVNYITTELHKGFSPLFNPNLDQEIKKTIFIPQLQKKFSYVNDCLQRSTYLMGDNFTLPDAYLFVMLRWAHALGLDLKACNHLTDYYNGLRKRASVEQSLQQEKE
ncbi:glutathione transferase GstA [Legionella dresdenensis]|uniref:Glutathione transferase GstA n=1 Tax=Legionella dresdenensis TaxID=450200 RepID=A0ABV8CEA8_9GAMM